MAEHDGDGPGPDGLDPDEREALRAVLAAGARYGYGHLVAALKSAWARMLVRDYGVPPGAALRAVDAEHAYPLDRPLPLA